MNTYRTRSRASAATVGAAFGTIFFGGALPMPSYRVTAFCISCYTSRGALTKPAACQNRRRASHSRRMRRRACFDGCCDRRRRAGKGRAAAGRDLENVGRAACGVGAVWCGGGCAGRRTAERWKIRGKRRQRCSVCWATRACARLPWRLARWRACRRLLALPAAWPQHRCPADLHEGAGACATSTALLATACAAPARRASLPLPHAPVIP